MRKVVLEKNTEWPRKTFSECLLCIVKGNSNYNTECIKKKSHFGKLYQNAKEDTEMLTIACMYT